MNQQQRGSVRLILLLFIFSGAVMLLLYFSWKNSFLSTTFRLNDIEKGLEKAPEIVYEWEKVTPNEKSKDFGDKNKFGYIKLGKGLWLINEDRTDEFFMQSPVSVSAAISPNNKYIAFVKVNEGLMVQKIKGIGPIQPTKLTNIFRSPNGATKGVDTQNFVWSPDSTKIAFSATYYPQQDSDYIPREYILPTDVIDGIYYVDLSNPKGAILLYAYKDVTTGYENNVNLVGWKPDSREVIIQEDLRSPTQTINIDTKEIKVFRTSKTGQYNWNRRGDKLTYFDYETDQIILEEGGTKKILAESSKKDGKQQNLSQRPQFSPDGKSILYHNSNFIEDREELWLVDITKSNFPKTLITQTGLNDMWPSGYWLSDNKTILYGINDTEKNKGFDIDLYLVSIDNKIPRLVAGSSYKPATSTSNTGLGN